MQAKYKVPLIVTVSAVIVSILGYGVYSYLEEQSSARHSDALYKFEIGVFKQYSDEKISSAELLSEVNKLLEDSGSFQGHASTLLRVSDELLGQGHVGEAESVILLGRERARHPYLKYLLDVRLAAIYEDTDRRQKAIELLSQMVESDVNLLEGKAYLDLGRLYLADGNKDKAREYFENVLTESDESDLVKLARLYMEKIQQ